jgi:hypothetical protein
MPTTKAVPLRAWCPHLSSPFPSLHAAPTPGPPCPLSSLPRHQAAIKGAGRCPFPFFVTSLFHPCPTHPHPPHHQRHSPLLLSSPEPLSPWWNHAKAPSSSPPLVSFASRMPLSLLLHGGRCLTFLSLSLRRKTRSRCCRPLRAPPPPSNATTPCHAASPLHRCAAVLSESTPHLLVWWLALLTVTLPPKTSPCLDLCSDGGGRAKAPSRVWPLHGDHGAERVARATGHHVGRSPWWAEPY